MMKPGSISQQFTADAQSKSVSTRYMIALSSIAFLIPLLLSYPQWFVRIIVNCTLIMTAMHLKGHYLIPPIILPSIGQSIKGIFLGFFIFQNILILPFIWVGNYAYVCLFRKLAHGREMHPFQAISLAAIGKTAIIFIPAVILYQMNQLTSFGLYILGPMQIATALIGGFTALGLNDSITHFFSKK